MNKRDSEDQDSAFAWFDEAGQSIVLIAFVFLILLAFTGLAVDAGFAFARSSQFSRAVDAATLAGVVDLDPTAMDTITADNRAKQFLTVNGWPTATLQSFDSSHSLTSLGIPEYTLTATWPVDFFFARLVGLDSFTIRHSASAAFYAQSDIFTPTGLDNGQIRTASQFIVGEGGCTQQGDPVVPLRSTDAAQNLDYVRYDGIYRYRIRVPVTYTETDLIHIELFDPDTANTQDGDFTIISSNALGGGTISGQTCDNKIGQSCIKSTGEDPTAIFENPIWLQKVDENFNSSCAPDIENGVGNTVTRFELYYLEEDDTRHSLAVYTDANSYLAQTDLQWVTPCEDCDVRADSGSFDVDYRMVTKSGEFYNIYLDVSSTGGSAKNVWDLRAGPENYYYEDLGLPPPARDVNLRNLQIANNPAAYHKLGIDVFALGRMPLQHYPGGERTMGMMPLDIVLGAGTIYASVFDYDRPDPWTDPDDNPLVKFRIDTLTPLDFAVDATIVNNPDPLNWEVNCPGGTGDMSCDNAWFYPQLRLGIPSDIFAGGLLQVIYDGHSDELVWSIAFTSGRPFLTK